MKTTLLSTAALIATSTLFTGTAFADHYQHMDEMANQLRNLSSRAAWEVHDNFRGSRDFRHLYSDMYEMYTLSDHIHELLHHGRNLNHIREDVEALDRTFHHVEELVAQIRPADDFHFHGGFHGGHGHFAPSGPTRSDLLRLRAVMDRMEDVLHHLQDDLRQLTVGAPPAPIVRPAPVVRPAPSRIQLGNGKFSVSLFLP